MRKPNPFLEKVGYKPERARSEVSTSPSKSEEPVVVQSSDTDPQIASSGGQWWGTQIKVALIRSISGAITAGVTAGVFTYVTVTATQDSAKSYRAPLSTAQTDEKELLESIKLERYWDENVADRQMEKESHGLKGLYLDWKTGTHRFVFGAGERQSYPVWLPLPRPSYKHEFDRLLHRGLSKIWLTEVHTPTSWSSGDLEARINLWANQCGVKAQSIPMWSSFRTVPSKRLENMCRPGGVCIIISNGPCAGNTFKELQARS